MNLKNTMVSERIQLIKGHILYELIYIKSKNRKNYSLVIEIRSELPLEGRARELIGRGHRELSGTLTWGDHTCVYICQSTVKSYTFNSK